MIEINKKSKSSFSKNSVDPHYHIWRIFTFVASKNGNEREIQRENARESHGKFDAKTANQQSSRMGRMAWRVKDKAEQSGA